MKSLEQHIRQREIELGASVSDKLAIYLDTKYWLNFRDVLLERKGGLERELFEKVRRLVIDGKAFCPLSDSSLAELLKQRDTATRNASADLIDSLSLGISICPLETRIAKEVAYLLSEGLGPNNLYPLRQLMWTRVSNVLGHFIPELTPFSAETQKIVNIEFFDFMWEIPFGTVIRGLGEGEHGLEVLDRMAEEINQKSAVHMHEMTDFSTVYVSEVIGFLDLYTPLLFDAAEIVLRARTGRGYADRDSAIIGLHALCLNDLMVRKGDSPLRTAYIHALLYAAVRWNRRQQLEGNTILDFRHASAGIAYCDIFLTERQLTGLSTAAHVALDKTFHCKIAGRTEAALEAFADCF